MKLELQRFGGRGASSGTQTIDGRPVVKSTSGYRFWPIGNNAPKGYIALIQGQGSNAKTAYIKSQYADEVANFRSAGTNAMNYDNMKTLDREITRRENRLAKVKETATVKQTYSIARQEQELKEMKRAREIRQKLKL